MGKSETMSCGFAKVGIKGGENISERSESSCARLSIKSAFKLYDKISILRNCSKVKLHHPVSLGLGLKGSK